MPIFLKSALHHPSSWSMLLADTMGQLVKYTSFQFKGTVFSVVFSNVVSLIVTDVSLFLMLFSVELTDYPIR